MKKPNRPLPGRALIALLCAALLCASCGARSAAEAPVAPTAAPAPEAAETPMPAPDPTPAPTAPIPASPAPTQPTEPPALTPEPDPAPDAGPAQLPAEFTRARERNPDVYAWLRLGCTGQEYPVLRNTEDPDYYLQRDVDGKASNGGALYTQSSYNGADFTDPCTVVYGHDLRSGRMFGSLEPLTLELDLDDAEDARNYFTVTTAEREQVFRIACAGVYADAHILHYHDFSAEEGFCAFFAAFRDYPCGARNLAERFAPRFGDRLCILLTCCKDDNRFRFLTVGVLTEERPAQPAS